MKENKWGSTFFLLVPTGRVSPLLWGGKGWKEAWRVAWRDSTLFPAFPWRDIAGKTSPGVHVVAGLSQTLQMRGAERQLVKYLLSSAWTPCLPSASQKHTCVHTEIYQLLSLHSSPSQPHSIKQICAIPLKNFGKNVGTSSGTWAGKLNLPSFLWWRNKYEITEEPRQISQKMKYGISWYCFPCYFLGNSLSALGQ